MAEPSFKSSERVEVKEMVCCAFLSVLIAAVLWLARRAVPRPALAMGGPLAWRLHHPTPTKKCT